MDREFDLGRLPSEEEHLLSGGKIGKRNLSMPFLERDEDWAEQLDSWLSKWQDKTGHYGKQPKAVAMAGRLLGSKLKIPLSHSVEDISDYLKRVNPKASPRDRRSAAEFVYGLTSPKEETVELTSYLEGDTED